ncbi:MAG: PAS domain-containing protein [Rickettsiales bacterium]
MTIRFAESLPIKDDTIAIDDNHDFVVRKRRPLWQTLCIMFAAVLPITILLSFFVENTVIFGQVLFVLLISVGTYVVVVIQKNRDLVLATEFQNALLSSALSSSNKFCLIIKDDGSISYIDRSFQQMFPDFYKEPRRAIDVLLERGQVSKDDRKIVFNALENRVHKKVILDITDAKGKAYKIVMSIEPIPRPKGFMLLRGREYIEKRVLGLTQQNNDNSNGLIFTNDNIALFSYLTDSMNIGAYLTTSFDNITYVNLTLEQWLYYDEGEIIRNGLSFKNLISQSTEGEYIGDIKSFNGELNLRKKLGGEIKVTLEQSPLYDEQGSITGYIGLVHNMDPEDKTSNKKKNNNNSW